MKLLTVADDISKCYQLERSARHFGWDLHIIQCEWKGFGTKVNKVYEYLKQNPDVVEFVFVDAYDTFVLKSPPEWGIGLINGLPMGLVSAEVNCWPDTNKLEQYDSFGRCYLDKFRFVNSGGYYMPSDLFISLVENYPISNDQDDQRWMTDKYLSKKGIEIDFQRQYFQTLCGITPEDYTMQNGFIMTNHGTIPTFIHGNGKADMKFIYDLLP